MMSERVIVLVLGILLIRAAVSGWFFALWDALFSPAPLPQMPKVGPS